MQELQINYKQDVEWQDALEPLAGAQIKLLREEGKKKTFILELPKDFKGTAHTHSTTDQHFILEGAYRSNGNTFNAGAYRLIPAGNAYDALTSEHGAVVLVIQEPL